MKRRISLLLTACLLSTFTFAGDFFTKRFFEVKLDIPLSVTNNAFQLKDLMQKEVVIDLGKIADNMPAKGFNVITTANPEIGVAFNILGVHAGVNTGVESFGKFGLSKDLFEFLGNGNEIGKDLDIGILTEADVFYHAEAEASLKIGKFKIAVTPSIFYPLCHVTTEDSHIKFNNGTDGSISVEALANAELYTAFDINNFDINQFPFDSAGFDIGGSVSFPFSDNLVLTGSIRTPIVPGRLKYVSSANFKWGFDTSLKKLASGDYQFDNFEKNLGAFEETTYTINRPMKLNVKADFSPFGNLLTFTGSLGFGIRNPFKKAESSWYPEYFFSANLSALSIIQGKVSTELTDEVFKHTISGSLNLRIFELDLGASLASSSFATSFGGAGFAAFITTYIGF